MPEPCHYCGQPVLLSKHNYRTQHIQILGKWERLIWHTKCDPYKVTTNVIPIRRERGQALVEYTLVLAVVTIITITVLTAISTGFRDFLTGIIT